VYFFPVKGPISTAPSPVPILDGKVYHNKFRFKEKVENHWYNVYNVSSGGFRGVL